MIQLWLNKYDDTTLTETKQKLIFIFKPSNRRNSRHVLTRGRRGRDRMVAGFTTTYATTDVVNSNIDQGEV
jgi:hypothetical protein